jgi:hypothetical protein
LFGIRFLSEPDAEVVNNQGEHKVAVVVFPQSRSERTGDIAVGLKKSNEAVVGDAAGLWEAVHSFADLDIDVPMVDERRKLVVLHDGVGDDVQGDAHVLVLLHRSVEVEVLQVAGHEASVWCGDGAVEEDLDGGDVCGFGVDLAGVINPIATYGEANASWVRFFWAVGGDDAEIGGLFVFWDLAEGDEEHGFRAGGHIGAVALAEAAELVLAGRLPEGTFAAMHEFGVLSELPRVGVEGVAMEGEVIIE